MTVTKVDLIRKIKFELNYDDVFAEFVVDNIIIGQCKEIFIEEDKSINFTSDTEHDFTSISFHDKIVKVFGSKHKSSFSQSMQNFIMSKKKIFQ